MLEQRYRLADLLDAVATTARTEQQKADATLALMRAAIAVEQGARSAR